LSCDQLGTTEFTGMLHVKKIQFYGWKQEFYFNKSRKAPRGKLPPEKNPPEKFLPVLLNFGNFFRQESLSENFGENVLKFYE
jgi:hypothetical protein